MRRIVVVLYGPPGAGKGTQANLLAEKAGVFHFDTGKFLENIIYDPRRKKDKLVAEQRKLFEGGQLMRPSFVTRELLREVKRLSEADWGIVLSGSPRTMYEAERGYPIFEKLYGKKNVHVFAIDVPPVVSLKRNSARMVCRACGYLLLSSFYPIRKAKHCPVCGGSFYKRTLDNPRVIKVRLKEYEERTFPIFKFLKKRGYRVIHVDGRPAPFKVMERINAHIKNAGRN